MAYQNEIHAADKTYDNGDPHKNISGTDVGEKRGLDVVVLGASPNLGTASPIHLTDEDVTIASGSPLIILTTVVPVDTIRYLYKIIVTTRAVGSFRIILNGTKIGSGRIDPANINVNFNFNPVYYTNAGDSIEIEFTMLRGPVGQPVEVYLMAADA